MYGRYRITGRDANLRYIFLEEEKVFGCLDRLLVRMLNQKYAGGIPKKWTLKFDDELPSIYAGRHRILINVTPRRNRITVCEINQVWGYSYALWTPIMIRLGGLFKDFSIRKFDLMDFSKDETNDSATIHTILYLNGGIQHGRISGKWTPGGGGVTNSALLWPRVLKHFKQILDSQAS